MAKAFLRAVRAKKRKAILANIGSVAYKEIARVMDQEVKPALVKAHQAVVYEWESDVNFAAKKFLRRDSITVYVYPTGKDKKVWIFVDRGTKEHDITAKKAPRLAFMWGGYGSYVPKTAPNPPRVVYGGGYVKDPTLRRPYQVHHPGTEARGFTEQIAKDYQPEFRRLIENAFRRAARRTYE